MRGIIIRFLRSKKLQLMCRTNCIHVNNNNKVRLIERIRLIRGVRFIEGVGLIQGGSQWTGTSGRHGPKPPIQMNMFHVNPWEIMLTSSILKTSKTHFLVWKSALIIKRWLCKLIEHNYLISPVKIHRKSC